MVALKVPALVAAVVAAWWVLQWLHGSCYSGCLVAVTVAVLVAAIVAVWWLLLWLFW